MKKYGERVLSVDVSDNVPFNGSVLPEDVVNSRISDIITKGWSEREIFSMWKLKLYFADC